ncbi:bifunctional GNAT family N-acetyltransferase/hotdog fold thioesterase [Oceanisphaera pacifica]|uniref:GNAT family N-acetyltransferase/hotdog fold thioesterase n=1 Tax=Oceanisphaera pacifica TaxID=2818389 RepID=A0ABS3NIY6_9GAMM|nr:bifunctional GNAT family N-acetyltransferase/hotdog fold thioesterase [Oceanisphaera pacifica]MBO1520505.1 GNAT family N-acetyltransferase/hotdog fold thioesterase [Oceanisphaera pacifica]
MYRVVTPQTDAELKSYYHLRWQLLRKPWQQPEGSERDEFDEYAHHRMMVDSSNKLVAVGRLYMSGDEAQIRFMAVVPECRDLGLGTRMVQALEQVARQQSARRLVMNAREEAVAFYSRCGFTVVGEGPISFGKIPHRQMIKALTSIHQIRHCSELCDELQSQWHRRIPISEKMGIRIIQYTGSRFKTKANLTANLNLHESMFAGSIYSQCVLTGWGLIWLQMQEFGLTGDIVQGQGDIKYLTPIWDEPNAEVQGRLREQLLPLQLGKRVRIDLQVTLYSGEQKAAVFNGRYVIMPH